MGDTCSSALDVVLRDHTYLRQYFINRRFIVRAIDVRRDEDALSFRGGAVDGYDAEGTVMSS